MKPREVTIAAEPIDRFGDLIGSAALAEAKKAAAHFRRRLGGRAIWNVNSTAVGGGVAEMLRPLLAYVRGVGVDARWLTIAGPPEFFRLTKRIHNALHGAAGDGSPLGGEQRRLYDEVMRQNASELRSHLRANDFVVLHDPQTLGLAPHLVQSGVHVIWRCHVGTDAPNDESRAAWEFLREPLADVRRVVFSRAGYAPDFADGERLRIVTPCIDPFSAKNQELDAAAVQTILVETGLLEGPPPPGGLPLFVREDGAPGRVERRADIVRLGRAPGLETPLVVQVSRWDRLKDPVGVIRGFGRMADRAHTPASELLLAGPNVHGVADDPEGSEVFDETLAAWRALPHAVRDRVHLACLPTADVQENAAIVNALQRHATIVVQKSLQEGFGLVVTEAMWKARPVLASGVGGIRDQIENGKSGVLLEDPCDLDAFASALGELLEDPDRARTLGEAARERVREQFLAIRQLLRHAALIEELIDEDSVPET